MRALQSRRPLLWLPACCGASASPQMKTLLSSKFWWLEIYKLKKTVWSKGEAVLTFDARGLDWDDEKWWKLQPFWLNLEYHLCTVSCMWCVNTWSLLQLTFSYISTELKLKSEFNDVWSIDSLIYMDLNNNQLTVTKALYSKNCISRKRKQIINNKNNATTLHV